MGKKHRIHTKKFLINLLLKITYAIALALVIYGFQDNSEGITSPETAPQSATNDFLITTTLAAVEKTAQGAEDKFEYQGIMFSNLRRGGGG